MLDIDLILYSSVDDSCMTWSKVTITTSYHNLMLSYQLIERDIKS
jgi:hypothetical protein